MAATLAVAASLMVATVVSTESATAAVGRDFTAGNIISDAKFHDAGAMTAGQVQSFLESKVPSCRSGYTCLRDFTQTTWSRAADRYCGSYTGGSNERASTIIQKVGAACGINPQVLLVLLQKEQTLVGSTSPTARAYNAATGYACPDTAPCSAEYQGFYNQVYKAAWQYKVYEGNPASFRYKANTVQDIQWHPNAACGTTRVYIENQATANLYIYTPYAPNAAALGNMYGTGDACSSYGNRNFWAIFTDWFGSTTGPRNPHGALDAAVGVIGGIQISGWAVDPYVNGSAYVWVTVDGVGRNLHANQPLSWIEQLYPGYGPDHGFDTIISAPPGRHEICVTQSNALSLGCATVTTPANDRYAGSLDAVTAGLGIVTVTGWALDRTTSNQGYVWINVDGAGSAARTDVDLPWTGTAYPGTGIRHGFDVDVPVSPGKHQICVYSGSSLLSCRTVTVVNNETGAVTSAAGVVGGINVTGWSLDQRRPTPTYVWVNVDGSGRALAATQPSAAANAAYPSIPGGHGFSGFFAARPGSHQVCVTTTGEGVSLGCRTVTVPNNEVGSFDTASGVYKGIEISGWSLDQTSARSTYVWVTVDGAGSAMAARQPLAWMNALYPGAGPNHGFAGTVKAAAGTRTVCVTGTEENVSLGCKSVVVPNSEVGSFDSAVGVEGGIDISGWSLDRTSSASTWTWVTVDGVGRAVGANRPLDWTNAYFPGVGSNHGFAARLDAAPGSHQVCVTGTLENVLHGCKTVIVPKPQVGSLDSVSGVAGGVRVTGWASDQTTQKTVYLWVTVDGVGRAVAADDRVSWIDGYFPGVGPNHGFDDVIAAAPGSHRVCVQLADSGRSLGCSAVVTP